MTEEQPDPRTPARQVADILAVFCHHLRKGIGAAEAISAAVRTGMGPVGDELVLALVRATDESTATLNWADLAAELRAVAAEWRTPLLTTFADLMRSGGADFALDYFEGVVWAAGSGRLERDRSLAEIRMSYPNHGNPWTDDEDDHLRAGINAGRTVDELAEDHGRSRSAIRARLVRLGLLNPKTGETAPLSKAG
jgi:hypothetical protein